MQNLEENSKQKLEDVSQNQQMQTLESMMLEAQAFNQNFIKDQMENESASTRNLNIPLQNNSKIRKSADITTFVPSQNGSNGDFLEKKQSSQGNKNPMGMITLKSMTSCGSKQSQESPKITHFKSRKFLNGPNGHQTQSRITTNQGSVAHVSYSTANMHKLKAQYEIELQKVRRSFQLPKLDNDLDDFAEKLLNEEDVQDLNFEQDSKIQNNDKNLNLRNQTNLMTPEYKGFKEQEIIKEPIRQSQDINIFKEEFTKSQSPPKNIQTQPSQIEQSQGILKQKNQSRHSANFEQSMVRHKASNISIYSGQKSSQKTIRTQNSTRKRNLDREIYGSLSSHSKIHNSSFIDGIKQLLQRVFEGQNQNFIWTQRALNQMQFKDGSGLLSICDAGLNDRQVQFFVDKISDVLKSKMIPEDTIRGVNFNGNSEITDLGLKLLIKLLTQFQTIKVLSLERFKVGSTAMRSLFNQLPATNIVELNVSGTPLSYFCVDSLCVVLKNERECVSLRVLHMRNTKLQDISALKLMEHVLGVNGDPVKIKFLSMSMNSQLGYKFQNGVVKMFQDTAFGQNPWYLKYIDLKFCNLSSQNLSLIERLIQQNNQIYGGDYSTVLSQQKSQLSRSKSKKKHSMSSIKSARKNSLNSAGKTIVSKFPLLKQSGSKSQETIQRAQRQSQQYSDQFGSQIRRSFEPYFQTVEVGIQDEGLCPRPEMIHQQANSSKQPVAQDTSIDARKRLTFSQNLGSSSAQNFRIKPEIVIQEQDCEGFTFQSQADLPPENLKNISGSIQQDSLQQEDQFRQEYGQQSAEYDGIKIRNDRDNRHKRYNTGQSIRTGVTRQMMDSRELQRADGNSLIEFVSSKKKRHSNSYNRAPKPLSMSDSIPDQRGRSQQPIKIQGVLSQHLIQNLNNFDLLNDLKGIKNMSSQQLIQQSVRNLFPQNKECNPIQSQFSTMQKKGKMQDQIKNLMIHDQNRVTDPTERSLFEQTFQKMNFVDKAQKRQRSPPEEYKHMLDPNFNPSLVNQNRANQSQQYLDAYQSFNQVNPSMNGLCQVSSSGDITRSNQGATIMNPYEAGQKLTRGFESKGQQSSDMLHRLGQDTSQKSLRALREKIYLASQPDSSVMSYKHLIPYSSKDALTFENCPINNDMLTFDNYQEGIKLNTNTSQRKDLRNENLMHFAQRIPGIGNSFETNQMQLKPNLKKSRSFEGMKQRKSSLSNNRKSKKKNHFLSIEESNIRLSSKSIQDKKKTLDDSRRNLKRRKSSRHGSIAQFPDVMLQKVNFQPQSNQPSRGKRRVSDTSNMPGQIMKELSQSYLQDQSIQTNQNIGSGLVSQLNLYSQPGSNRVDLKIPQNFDNKRNSMPDLKHHQRLMSSNPYQNLEHNQSFQNQFLERSNFVNSSFSQQSQIQSQSSYSAIEPDDAKRIQLRRDQKINQLKKYSSLSFAEIDRSNSHKGRKFLRPKKELENFLRPRKVPGSKNLCVTKIDMENRYLRESRCSLPRDSFQNLSNQNGFRGHSEAKQDKYPQYYPCNNIQINNNTDQHKVQMTNQQFSKPSQTQQNEYRFFRNQNPTFGKEMFQPVYQQPIQQNDFKNNENESVSSANSNTISVKNKANINQMTKEQCDSSLFTSLGYSTAQQSKKNQRARVINLNSIKSTLPVSTLSSLRMQEQEEQIQQMLYKQQNLVQQEAIQSQNLIQQPQMSMADQMSLQRQKLLKLQSKKAGNVWLQKKQKNLKVEPIQSRGILKTIHQKQIQAKKEGLMKYQTVTEDITLQNTMARQNHFGDLSRLNRIEQNNQSNFANESLFQILDDNFVNDIQLGGRDFNACKENMNTNQQLQNDKQYMFEPINDHENIPKEAYRQWMEQNYPQLDAQPKQQIDSLQQLSQSRSNDGRKSSRIQSHRVPGQSQSNNKSKKVSPQGSSLRNIKQQMTPRIMITENNAVNLPISMVNGQQISQHNVQQFINQMGMGINSDPSYQNLMNQGHSFENSVEEKDNTKSCSTMLYSPSLGTYVNRNQQIQIPQQEQSSMNHNRNLNSQESNDFGNLRMLIKEEIDRLQSLYQKIDTIMVSSQNQQPIQSEQNVSKIHITSASQLSKAQNKNDNVIGEFYDQQRHISGDELHINRVDSINNLKNMNQLPPEIQMAYAAAQDSKNSNKHSNSNLSYRQMHSGAIVTTDMKTDRSQTSLHQPNLYSMHQQF